MCAPRRGLWAVLCAVLLAAGGTGCGTRLSTTEDPREPVAAVRQAVQNSLQTSYRFSVHERETPVGEDGRHVFGGPQMVTFGVFDPIQGIGRLTTGLGSRDEIPSHSQRVIGREIITRETTYVSIDGLVGLVEGRRAAELAGKWVKGEPGSDRARVMPDRMLPALRDVVDVQRVGVETVRGVPTDRYRGTLTAARATQVAFGWSMPPPDRDEFAGSNPVRVWIDRSDRIRKISVRTEFDPGGHERFEFAMTLEMFDYGVRAHVEAPPASDVVEAKEVYSQFDQPARPDEVGRTDRPSGR